MNVGPEVARKARLFLSYSRMDKDFARRLAEALVGRGHVADYDQSSHDPTNVDTGISAEDEWWKRLQEMIATAEVVIFIVSPHSAASKVCDEEIAYARALGKRIIPVLRAPVDFASTPPRLSALNVKLSFQHDEAFDLSLSALTASLDVDVVWHREGARLTAAAVKWDTEGRPDSQLPSGGGVADAQAWIARRPANAPPAGELLTAFLDAGSIKAAIDRERLLTITGRAFVKPAEQALEQGRCDAALRISAAGTLLSEDADNRLVPERTRSSILAAASNRLCSTLLGHEDRVACAAFSPDGTLIVTASRDGTARVWDAATGAELAILRGHAGPVVSATFGSDGTRIVTASEDATARVWDAATGAELALLRGHGGPVVNATFGSDGTRIVTASEDKTARVWDAATGAVINVLKGKNGRWSGVVASADGARIAAVCGDAALVWDALSGRRIGALRSPRKHGINCVAFSPDGTHIVTASNGKGDRVRVWDAKTMRKTSTLRAPRVARKNTFGLVSNVSFTRVSNVSFSPDGMRIITVGAEVYVWDSATGQPIMAMKGGAVQSASFSPDGTRIVTASVKRLSLGDTSARIWDAGGAGRVHRRDWDDGGGVQEELVALHGHEAPVAMAVFSPDGTRIVTVSADGTGRVWDAAIEREIARIDGPGGPLRSAALSPDETRVVIAGRDTVQVWDVATGQRVVDLRGHTAPVNGVSFSPDGARIVTASEDNSGRVWDVASGRQMAVLLGHQESFRGISTAAFSPDGSKIVTASWDGTGRVWDPTDGREMAVLRGHTKALMTAAFSPDGALIITASQDGTARVFDVSTAREIKALSGHEGIVRSAAYSPDGTKIVTASEDDTGRVWEAESGRELCVLRGHRTGVRGLSGGVGGAAFSPDGTRIVTASWDGTARIWNAVSGLEIMALDTHGAAAAQRNVSAAFNLAGTRVVTTLNGLRVWDASSSEALIGSVAELVAASLTNGRGVRTSLERLDLLMKNLGEGYDSLGTALASRLESAEPAAADRVGRIAKVLGRPLHPNCYLPSWAREWSSPLDGNGPPA